MNSFESNDELSRLAATNPVANRVEPSDSLFEVAFSSKTKTSRLSGTVALAKAWSNHGNRWAVGGLALTASVAVALSVFHAPAGSGGYLITTAGTANSSGVGQSKMAAGATASTSMIAGGPMNDMAIMMPAVHFNYVAGSALSGATDSAHIYQIVPDGNAKDIANALAEVFGIAGGVSKSDKTGDNYELYFPTSELDQQNQSEDLLSTNRSFYVNSSVWGNSFGYWDNATMRWLTCQQQIPAPKGCDAIAKEQLPSLAEARAQAAKVLHALGLRSGTTLANTPDGGYLIDASYQDNTYGTYTVTSADGVATDATAPTQPENWQAKSLLVTASLVVAGQVTPVQIQFNWQPGASDLGGVYGEVAKAVDAGTFGTISAKDAVTRLDDYGYSGQSNLDWNTLKWSENSYSGMPEAMRKQAMACSGTVTVGSDTLPVTGADSGAATPDATPTPAPDCTLPLKDGIPQIEATVTKAEQTSLMIWDSNNGRWLVPGYNFYDSTGYLGSAFSVVDGVIKIDAPTQAPMMTK